LNIHKKKPILTEKKQTEPGFVPFYDIRPGNRAGLFLQPRSPRRAAARKSLCTEIIGRCMLHDSETWSLKRENALDRNEN